MKRLFKWLSILFGILLLGAGGLACCSSSAIQERAAATQAPAQRTEADTDSPAATANVVEAGAVAEEVAAATAELSPTAEPPTAEPSPTAEPLPTAELPPTPEPLPVGRSRSMPHAPDDVVTNTSWEVQLLEVKRGEAAWVDLQAANMFNEPPTEDEEYVLVRLRVRSLHTDSEEHRIGNCDFDLTGDRLINYTCSSRSVVSPEPQLDASLFAGGETEGWIAYAVGRSETNLILVLDELLSFDLEERRFIALEAGASVGIPTELGDIQPTGIGVERGTPAAFSEMVVTEDWEITLLEAVRGEDAWTMVQAANQFNDPPEAGMEYVAVRVRARHIGTDDRPAEIGNSNFRATGSAGVLHDNPFVVEPEPKLDSALYPGGTAEGWVVVQAQVDESDVMIVFEESFDLFGTSRRYIALDE